MSTYPFTVKVKCPAGCTVNALSASDKMIGEPPGLSHCR